MQRASSAEVVDQDGVIVTRPEFIPAVERTPQQVAALLARPFPPEKIKTKPGAFGLIHYVAIGDVLDRLNRACAEWNWTVTKIEVHTLPIKRNDEMVPTPIVHVTGIMQIPGLGTRGAVGTAPAENNEDPAKIAESDAIKRAATMFGVPGGR